MSGRRSREAVMRFRHKQEVDEIPDEAVPASIEIDGSVIVLTGFGKMLEQEEATTPHDFEEYCKQKLPDSARWAVPHLETMDSINIAEAIINNSAIAVSDGSFKQQHGTASWILQGNDDYGEMCDQCVVPGHPDDQSAYRSELTGLYAMLIAVKMICQFHDIQEGTVTMACDGQSALNKAKFAYEAASPEQPQYDLIGAIWKLREESPITWKFHWVKGHQDDKKKTSFLDRWESLNVRMDTLAKEHWEDTFQQTIRQYSIHGEPWPVWIGDRKISSCLKGMLTTHIDGGPCMAYWKKKERFGELQNPEHEIDWDANNKAMAQEPRSANFCLQVFIEILWYW